MKKTLVSLGLVTALLVPAGVAYAQSDVAMDDTVTCRALDGAGIQNGYGAQNQARLDDGAPFGDPENCPFDGDQTRLHEQARLQDGEGSQYGAQNHQRLAGEGQLGDPENCPNGGDGGPQTRSGLQNQTGFGNGAGSGFGRTGS